MNGVTQVPANRILLLVMAVLLHGCASTSVFQAYPRQADNWKMALQNGRTEAALKKLERRSDSADRLLYLQERARLEQLTKRYDASLDTFKRVFDLYEQGDAEARFRVSEAGSGTASLLTNDNAIPYSGFAYERIFAHGFQALNYLARGDYQAAAVEWRRASLEQRVAEQQRAALIARAEERAREEGVDPRRYETHFSGLNTAASEVKSAINNAWVFYLSGAFREGRGEYNDARVDYKKALEMNPDSEMLRTDVQRVTAKMEGRIQDDRGLVVVSYEQGFVPPRREISIPIPTIHGYFAVAFPTYDPRDFTTARPLRVHAGGETRTTEALAPVGPMAARALKERLPAMLVRQALRASAKYAAQKRAHEQLGPFAAFTTQIYNLVSERADLRSWLTLPAHAQATRLRLPAGEHELELSAPGGGATVSVPVTAGATTFVRAVQPASELRVDVLPAQEETR